MEEKKDLKKNKEIEMLNKENRDLKSQIEQLSSQVCELQSRMDFLVERQRFVNAFSSLELHKLSSIPNGGILLCGNYGNPNTGDEWMLDTILSYIREYTYQNITIMLESNYNFDPTIYLKYNVYYIHYPQTIYDYELLAQKFNTLIFGGGAIVEDKVYFERYDNEVNICRTVVDLSLRFITQRKSVLCIGLSTSQKIENDEYIHKLRKVINLSDFFSVRDIYSLETLRQIDGISHEKIKVIPDIVYANAVLQETIGVPKNLKNKELRNIGIVFICTAETKIYFEYLIDMLETELAGECDSYKINLIPFFDFEHADIRFYEDMIRENKKMVLYHYNPDITYMIKLFMQQDLVICARYHAILLAFSLGIPCVPLYYDTHQHYFNKISYLMEQFGFSINDCIPISKIKSCNGNILCKNIQMNNTKIIGEIVKVASEEIRGIMEKTL